MTDNNSVTTQE